MTTNTFFKILLIFIIFLSPKLISFFTIKYNFFKIYSFFYSNKSLIKFISKSSLITGALILIFSFFTDFNSLNILAIFLIPFSHELDLISIKSVEYIKTNN